MRNKSFFLSLSFISIIVMVVISKANSNGPIQSRQQVLANKMSSRVNHTEDSVTYPPASLQLDPFYEKYLDASGIPIVGSKNIDDAAFYAVQQVVNKMVSMRPDVLAQMIKNKLRVGIIGISEVTTDMPEYRDLPGRPDDSRTWNDTRGLGATTSRPLSGCAEENVLCYGQGKDPYFNEDILIHEFAHSIHELGILFVNPSFDKELNKAFENAKAKGLWVNTYAQSNYAEYFAEGVQDWFNINAYAVPTDGIHNEIHTRSQLAKYDPVLYNIIKQYFPDDDEKVSCHQ